MTNFSEDVLIEQPAIVLLSQLGWSVKNCYHESFGENSILGRETSSDVVLRTKLLPALNRINPSIPQEALQMAYDELIRDRTAFSPTEANRQVTELLKNGVPVCYKDSEGTENFEFVKIIDWQTPTNNDFFLASQFWVSGEIYKRRADLVGFVNGIPLLFIELKAAHIALKNAFEHNLRDYKKTIPQLFWYNAFIILSNGSESKIGSMSAAWEHFSEWKKINSEGEQGIISLETILKGTCEPSRFLDIIENFTLFNEAQGGLQKIIAKNHQYLGVNNAIAEVQNLQENQGKLGVFWHTQGSGKSFSMVFFSQKVLRKLPGNWTFVVITDRKELDDQIYKNFADCHVVTESQNRVRAGSGEHLKQLLQEDHRFVFTLIQKFHIESGQKYPVLSERSNIIVMSDEAHRSQYDVLALNMRNALPNAAFMAYTGTPLIVGEEKTKQVFGDYVSIYDFKQSADDQATVPLFYENRIPELQLTNPNLNEDMAELLDNADLDENQEEKLEREFKREYQLITRDERLEKISEDIVLHFLGRGYQGKSMVVCIDKATAVRMFDKVKKYWNIQLALLQCENQANHTVEDWESIQTKIKFMRETDMAVVVSQGQNEIEDMEKKGANILQHRLRMNREDLATKFKDPSDPFRLVFVCAMWMTGFDAPSCSTIYLDKPMKNHTLMQTIARANRVFKEKVNGLIVDYIGVFRDLQKALAIYGSGTGGTLEPGELPVQDKQALVDVLRAKIAETRQFLFIQDVDLDKIIDAESFEKVRLLTDAVDDLLVSDEIKRQFLTYSLEVDRLFTAILPDVSANEFGVDRKTIVVIAQRIRSLIPPADISEIVGGVEQLLDESIAPLGQGYVIKAPIGYSIGETTTIKPSHWVDISKIDFDALKKQFEKSHKRIEAEKLRGLINSKLRQMVRLNHSRMNYYEQFQQMINDYNSGAKNIDTFFAQLVTFAQNLTTEEQRGISENLSEEELAIFDILTRPNLKLSKQEKDKVKEVAKELLTTLKSERLVLDWRKNQKTRAGVRLAIEETLDHLPENYNIDIYKQKCDSVYEHVYDAYYGEGKKSIYV
jgi:type I restriction enzyme R subunit